MGQSQAMLLGLVLALILGMFGQCVRVIAGLKKLADESAAKGQRMAGDFVWTRFLLSLATGAVAGIAAFLGFWFGGKAEGVDPTNAPVIFGIVSAGYAGADFIEAFVKKHLPDGDSQRANAPAQGGQVLAAAKNVG
jgi:hypothetical protein